MIFEYRNKKITGLLTIVPKMSLPSMKRWKKQANKKTERYILRHGRKIRDIF